MLFLRSVLGGIFQEYGAGRLAEINAIVREFEEVGSAFSFEIGKHVGETCTYGEVFLLELSVQSHPSIDGVEFVLVGRAVFDRKSDFGEAFLLVTEVDVLEFNTCCEAILFVEGRR